MQKNIVKTSPVSFGHLMLEFEGGTKQMVHRDHDAMTRRQANSGLPMVTST